MEVMKGGIDGFSIQNHPCIILSRKTIEISISFSQHAVLIVYRLTKIVFKGNKLFTILNNVHT